MEGKDIATRLVSDPLDLKETFFTNLLLLGFDPEAEEANHRIPLNRDMFLFPNKKAMEIVCHFLFCRLDPQLAYQEFRDCWPIGDKKMEQQFRKSCHSWLSKLHKEEQDSNLPRIGPSLFLSPGGGRFLEVMFYFSTFVLQRVMVREHGKHGQNMPEVCKKTTKNPSMTTVTHKAFKAKILVERDRFFKGVQKAIDVQEHWKSYAMSSTKEYRKQSKEHRELEKRLGPKEKSTSFEEETAALHRTRKLQEVRDLWNRIEHFYSDTKEKRAILDAIVQGNEERFCIDGSKIELQVPEVLTQHYQHYIQMNNIGNTYQAGKLNLLSVVQLCNLALHQLKEHIIQDGVGNFEQSVPFINSQLHSHAAYLANAQKLRTTLNDNVIPALKKYIENLKEECYVSLESGRQSPVLVLEHFDFGLGLVPSTPAPVFSPANQPLRGKEGSLPEDLLKRTPGYKDTPDAVENLIRSAREMVNKGENAVNKRLGKGGDVLKPFSKIPRPVNKRQSQTPNVSSRKQPSLTRRVFLTNPKKSPRRTAVSTSNVNNGTAGSAASKLYPAQARVTSLKPKPIEESFPLEKLKRFSLDDLHDDVDEYRTPMRGGLKSALKKNPDLARNVLAEKIAKAVFADEPRICTGNSSSQSSSGENTPKDIGVADPLDNIHDTPFRSKDLIPRTPFKDDANGLEPSPTAITHDIASPNLPYNTPPHTMSSHASSVRREPATLSPTATPFSSPYLTELEKPINGEHDLSYIPTPGQNQPITISWKTPISSSTSLNATSYTPIESKLGVVDTHTPFSEGHRNGSPINYLVDRLERVSHNRSADPNTTGRSVNVGDGASGTAFEGSFINSLEAVSPNMDTPQDVIDNAQTKPEGLTFLARSSDQEGLLLDFEPSCDSLTDQVEPRSVVTPLRSSATKGSPLLRSVPLLASGIKSSPLDVTEPKTRADLKTANFDKKNAGTEEYKKERIGFDVPENMTSGSRDSSCAPKSAASAVIKKSPVHSSVDEDSSIKELLLRYQRLKAQQELAEPVSSLLTSPTVTPATDFDNEVKDGLFSHDFTNIQEPVFSSAEQLDGQKDLGSINNNEHEKSLDTDIPVKTGLLIDFD